MITHTEIDARLGPVLEAFDRTTAQFDLKAGESIYMLALTLWGSIQEAPEDIRDLFRARVIEALHDNRPAGFRRLQRLCFDGKIE